MNPSSLHNIQTDQDDTYKEIFNQRGQCYHNAMTQFPEARNQEFELLIDKLNLSDGDKLIDIPSGGGYLHNYLDKDIELHSVDEAKQFITTDKLNNKYCCDTCHTPFNDNTFDKAYSLAGSHHMPDKSAFYNEVHRILKPGGIFAYADVAENSPADRFLNIFVNEYNSMGHQGEFLNINRTSDALTSCNFTIANAYLCQYQWAFSSQTRAANFFKNLFGLDLATNKDIINGIDKYLNPTSNKNSFYVDWQLLHFKCVGLEI